MKLIGYDKYQNNVRNTTIN